MYLPVKLHNKFNHYTTAPADRNAIYPIIIRKASIILPPTHTPIWGGRFSFLNRISSKKKYPNTFPTFPHNHVEINPDYYENPTPHFTIIILFLSSFFFTRSVRHTFCHHGWHLVAVSTCCVCVKIHARTQKRVPSVRWLIEINLLYCLPSTPFRRLASLGIVSPL